MDTGGGIAQSGFRLFDLLLQAAVHADELRKGVAGERLLDRLLSGADQSGGKKILKLAERGILIGRKAQLQGDLQRLERQVINRPFADAEQTPLFVQLREDHRGVAGGDVRFLRQRGQLQGCQGLCQRMREEIHPAGVVVDYGVELRRAAAFIKVHVYTSKKILILVLLNYITRLKKSKPCSGTAEAPDRAF